MEAQNMDSSFYTYKFSTIYEIPVRGRLGHWSDWSDFPKLIQRAQALVTRPFEIPYPTPQTYPNLPDWVSIKDLTRLGVNTVVLIRSRRRLNDGNETDVRKLLAKME
jgi:hypothetical protein